MKTATRLLKEYWVELVVFGSILTVLLIDCIPDITWINTDCDGPHYIYSAKYLYPAHKTSAPLFLLLGHVFLKLPFGTEAWRFAMLSVLATTVACIFIYLATRYHTRSKWCSIISILVYGSSALVISQSIIIETYALVTMFGTAAYYFSIKRKWVLTALMLGAGGAIHHLIGIPILILLIFNKELRNWKYIGIMASFLLFYLYIPITNRPPYMWQSPTSELATGFLSDNLSTMLMLWGGLSIWELPKRILDTIGLLGISLGFAIIPISVMLKQWKSPLFWLFTLPIIYYATNLAPQTYVYMMPSIAAGAILAGLGIKKLQNNPAWCIHGYDGIFTVTLIGMLIFNANYFDVGRTLDKNLSARKFWSEELSKVPNNHVLLAQQGWEWAMVYPYNMDNDRNIIPICTGTLASIQYQDLLKSWGVNFDIPKEKVTLVELQNYIIKSITDNNENVWTTFPTNTRTYGAEVVPIKYTISERVETSRYPITIGHIFFSNENYNRLLSELVTPQGITDGSMDSFWRWKPSNPYDIITGAIEVEEWVYIVFSNYSVLTFTMLGTIGLIPSWILYMLIFKKKRWNVNKCKEVLAGQ